MLRGFWRRLVDVLIGVIIGFLLAWDIVFARSIDMAKAGVTLWIFLAVGLFIILLQAIPAIILITTYMASIHHTHKERKTEDEVENPVLKREQEAV